MLQKFEHGGRESFGHAIYLVDKEYALFFALLFDRLVNARDYFAHRVLGYRIGLSSEFLFGYERKPYRRLPRMVSYRIP